MSKDSVAVLVTDRWTPLPRKCCSVYSTASLQSGVSPIGTVVGGIAMDRWGRRVTMIAGLLPLFIGYMTIAFSQSHLMVLIGRFITGTSTGFAAAASVVSTKSTPVSLGTF
jgi:MFS family permease